MLAALIVFTVSTIQSMNTKFVKTIELNMFREHSAEEIKFREEEMHQQSEMLLEMFRLEYQLAMGHLTLRCKIITITIVNDIFFIIIDLENMI